MRDATELTVFWSIAGKNSDDSQISAMIGLAKISHHSEKAED